jgi:hypothetical protein
VKPVNSNPAKWGHPVKWGHLIRFQTCVLSANCPVKWGHLSFRDTFGSSQGCPYFTGFTLTAEFEHMLNRIQHECGHLELKTFSFFVF